MRFSFGFVALAGLVTGWPSPEPHRLASRAVAYVDPDTGFTFSESKAAATLSQNIVFRVAQPANIPANSAYDIVLQVVAPQSLGWVGLAWGGSMIKNPLTVSYPNGQKATVSSRWATAHSTPAAYTGAVYTLLTGGQKSNSTHWQFTAKCSGCTAWTGASGATRIDPASTKRLGYACSSTKVSSPGSTTATIATHDVYNYFNHDFSAGSNANFAALLSRNGVSGGDDGNATQRLF